MSNTGKCCIQITTISLLQYLNFATLVRLGKIVKCWINAATIGTIAAFEQKPYGRLVPGDSILTGSLTRL